MYLPDTQKPRFAVAEPRTPRGGLEFRPGVAVFFDGANVFYMDAAEAAKMLEGALNDAERDRLTGPNNG